jgi:hypothetical protein
MIADRPYLAAQVKAVRRELSGLADWIDNPARPFPGDAVALAEQFQWVAALLLADDEIPGGPAAAG